MKKILIIAYSSTPLTAPRGTQANRLINKLSDNYSIFLITSSKSTSDTVSYFNKNITITSIKSTNKKILSLISKILSFWSVFDTYWFIQSVFKSLLIIRKNKIDTVVTLSMNLSNFSSGLWLKIFLGSKIKLFSFLSDPISFNHYYIKNSMLKHRFAKYFEKIGFKMCDFIVVPSQLMQTKYIELYPIYKYKFKTIPHSYKRVNQSLNFKSNKPKEVTHLGTLSSLRTPIPIIKAILKNEQFFKEKQIHFKFIGHIDKEIKESLNKNNYISEIISFVGKIPITEIESHITSASILLVIDANLPFSPYLPSKLVDMMPYNKPILGITPINSESARVLSLTNNAFITYENLSQFGFVIKNVLETDYIPKNLSQFHIDNIGYQWDLILNS